MKDGLENSFKEALNDFEYPYDAKAWDALNQKLSPKKWYQHVGVKWSAALVISIGVATYFTLPTSETHARKETHDKTSTDKGNPSTTNTLNQSKISPSTNKRLVEKINSTALKNPLMSIDQMSPVVVTELIPHSIPLFLDQLDVLGLTDQAIDQQEPTPSFKAGMDIVDFKNRCQGETLQLEADNRHERIVIYSGEELHFSYNEAISLKLTEPGKVTLTANTGPYGQFEEFGSFVVSATPTLNITSDRLLNYEDGLPKINVQAEASEGQITWHSTNIISSNSGKNIELLGFDKGFAIVEVQATGGNGCLAKVKEMIQIPSDYNLLAVNAFNPQSKDSRNSTFMPYALTIRQTPFKLIVLDPDNGGLVFESRDADNAWDGIDRRDGVMVPSNKAYIWKVVLQNPVAGEKAEYRGTIVRM